MAIQANYENMKYRRCGNSGVKLPMLSLGLWHNFGTRDNFENARSLIRTAFENGIVHFDLANNYGPDPGSAEENFGAILKQDYGPLRDEMFISTKAGYTMWPGPYGDFGSRKYLISSLDQSLKRMGIDYVDLFYHHRPDPETPLEETMSALADIVRSGKALYVGISNYNAVQTAQALEMLRGMGVPCLIHQASYSMLNRWVEDGLTDVLYRYGAGMIAFSPLAQGQLTARYAQGIPGDSRAAGGRFLKPDTVRQNEERVRALQDLASWRGQTLAQMALSWVLRDENTTSALIGASRPEQILENIGALSGISFTEEECACIDGLTKM